MQKVGWCACDLTALQKVGLCACDLSIVVEEEAGESQLLVSMVYRVQVSQRPSPELFVVALPVNY